MVSRAEVVIIGGGFSGIGVAVALQRAGFDDFLLVEAGDGVGGAWHWNTYPGIQVDIPSFSYQFSFRKRHDWSRVYAPGDELKAYAEDCVDHYGLRPKLRLNTTITGGTWDDDEHVWRLETNGGPPIVARYAIGATGVLTQPKPPAIPGVGEFTGTTMHTARWDDGVELRGKRVALIGTGASAVQVIPSIAPDVERLTVFQRTPIWCLPKLDGPMPRAVRRVLELVPGAEHVARLLSQTFIEMTFPVAAHYASVVPMAKWSKGVALKHLEDQVKDPVVRDRLTPRYDLGCKRPGFSNDYLRTFNRENVQLETAPITKVEGDRVETAEGEHGPLDVLILATGFKVFESGNMPPFPTRGVDGLDLERFFTENRLQSYQGVTIPGFPNMFSILGPYGYNGASYFTLIENQSRHIVRCLKRAREIGATRIEVTEQAKDRYMRQMLGRRHRQVFFHGSCATANSYYFDRHGDVPFRPATTLEVMWKSARFPFSDYAFA
ncbi:MAG TPA: NAD(P)/FAD-dependent oxidoreductase [Thermoleophilaceae bacterium]|nr:NAD(P)/FAD-dependent oxidoreductase [Thermoleophilaceae bacterium]